MAPTKGAEQPTPTAEGAEQVPEASGTTHEEPTLTVSASQLAELISAQVALAVGQAMATKPNPAAVPFQGVEFVKPDGPKAVMTLRPNKDGAAEVKKVCEQFVPMMEALGWTREDQG